MSTNLVGLERAKLAVPDATAGDERTLDALIAGVSAAIAKWCGRSFALTAYDENPQPARQEARLLLGRFPVQSVEAVRHSPAVVMQVVNTDVATNQQARLTVTGTALELSRVASGVKAVNTLPYSSYATLQALATAVAALGNGWSAAVVGSPTGDYGLWPSADLFVPPWVGDGSRSTGALSCRGASAPLVLHVGECNAYQWDSRGWLDLLDDGLAPVSVWNPHFNETWEQGSLARFYRVQYTAGYAEIPDDVQAAACAWVAALWWQSKRDPAVQSQAIAGSISTTYVHEQTMPALSNRLLAPYRARNI